MKKRLINCVLLSSLTKPGVIWRFFRRYYFSRLHRQIERLPKRVRAMGNPFHG